MNSSYERLTFRNIGYNSIAKMMMFIFSAITSVVLGRCLAASDYGIVSFAFIFINFMANFADFGIGSAIIQRKELDNRALNSAFTLKLLIGCAVVGASFFLSFAASFFFDNPHIIPVIRLLSLNFLISTVSFIPNSLLTRDMDFKKISIAEITLSLLNSTGAIILALNGYGYWSIVAAYIFANLVYAVMMARFRPVAVRLCFDKKTAKEFLSFGGYLFLSGLLVFLIFNLDNFIIGTVNGAKDLGYYAIAYNWGSMICILMYMVVLRAIFPWMAKLQDEEQRIRNAYLKTLEYSGYLVVLVNIVLFIVSRDFLYCVLGHNSDKWMPALVPLRILCVYGILRGLLEPVGQVIIAKGKPKTLLTANLLASVIEVAAIYPALKYFGINGVACVVTFAYLSQYLVYYLYLKDQLQIGITDLAKAVTPSFSAALPLLFLYPAFSEYQTNTILLLLVKASAIAAVYILTLGIITNWEIFKVAGSFVLQEKNPV